MKKLMILGAGVYQVPLIKKAKEMGIQTIVVSIEGNYPGFKIADKIYYVDTTDCDAVLEIAEKEKIDGIVTTGTDVAVVTIGKVCDAMHLPGVSYEAAKIASNKTLMKIAYEENGVRTAKFRKVSFDRKDIEAKIAGLDFPLIFKATDTSGSRGIIRVDSISEFDNAIAIVKAATKLDTFIIEEFLEGTEFGAQGFVQNGELKMMIPHGDYVFNGDTGVPVGHYAPYDMPEAFLKDVEDQFRKAVKAMKLNNCALNADFMLYKDKAYVLEIGARAGATCLVELVSIYYDYNYYEKIINVALGMEEDFTSDKAIPNASHLLMSDKDGVIASQENNNEPDDNLVDVQFDYNVGDEVKKFRVGPHRIGHIVTKGADLAQATKVLENAMKNIKIDVK